MPCGTGQTGNMAEPFNYSNILIELNKAVKMHNFYPQGHPNLDQALGKCYILLRKRLDEYGEIKWQIDQKGFYDNKVIIASGSLELSVLAKKFVFRRIREITFTGDLTQADLKIILEIVKLEPEDIQAKGGPESLLASRDSRGILLNEMRYEDLMKMKKELEEKKVEEEIESILEPSEEGGEDEKEAEKKPEPEKAVHEDDLAMLLERIAKETDFLLYNDLLQRLREKTEALAREKKFDALFPAMLILSGRAGRESDLSEGLKETTAELLDSLLKDGETLLYLIYRIGSKDDPDKDALQAMLLRAKDKAIDLLLDAIVDAPDASTRRNLFNAVLLFGDDITPMVEKRLKSDQWYVVRQMVALLGALANPATVQHLVSAFNHSNVKVKREVLKSLGRIQTPRSTELLLSVVEKEDPVLAPYAVISLGILRDASAVDAVGRIAVKWKPFSDKQEAKREAIKALGMIGSKTAVPTLVKILTRTSWFGKRLNEDFRCLAANSLAMIGGDEAFKAIEEAGKGSDGDLLRTCKRLLEGKPPEGNAPAVAR